MLNGFFIFLFIIWLLYLKPSLTTHAKQKLTSAVISVLGFSMAIGKCSHTASATTIDFLTTVVNQTM